MKFNIKLLLLVITLLPYVGYTFDTPKTPYGDEIKKMREILIKSQFCVEKEYFS